MKSLQYIFISFLLAGILTSCTTQKRMYRPGYHTDWLGHKNSNHKSVTEKEPIQNNSVISNRTVIIDSPTELSASADNKDVFSSKSTPQLTEIVSQLSLQQQKKAPELNKKLKAITKKGVFKKTDVSGGGKGAGLAMILVALLLFLIGYALSVATGVFGILFLLIFGIAAGILFLFGLIMLFSSK